MTGREAELNAETSDELPEGIHGSSGWLHGMEDVILREGVYGKYPRKFWYERFLPTLLRACSVTLGGEPGLDVLVKDDEVLEKHMDNWFQHAEDAGEFEEFGTDIAEAWNAGKLDVKTKLTLRRAWRLNRYHSKIMIISVNSNKNDVITSSKDFLFC